MVESSALMVQLLQALAANANQFRHPILARTVARTLGSLSAWVDTSSDAARLVHASTSYLVGSLAVEGASHDVAEAVQRMLRKCGKWINDPRTVAQLVASVNAAMSRLHVDDQIVLVDGLATVVVTMAPADARGGMEMLCGPILDRVSAALQQFRAQATAAGASSPDSSSIEAALAGGMRSFAFAIKHLDSFKNRSRFAARNRTSLQTVAGGIMQKAWPVISTVVAESGRLGTPVVDSLFEVLRYLIQSLAPLMGPNVGVIVEAAVNAYRRNLSGAALSCLVSVADTFGKERAAVLGQALQRLYEPTARAFAGGGAALAARTDTVVDFFKLVHIVGIRSPEALGLHTLEWLVPMATACVSVHEFMAAKQVAQVLVMLLKSSPANASGLSAAVDQVMNSGGNGPRLAQTLLAAIAQHAPDRLVPQHADVLYHLSARYAQECQKWVFNFLAPVPEATLTRSVKGKIMELLFFAGHAGAPAVRRKRRFKGVLEDVGKICRGATGGRCALGV